MKLQLKRSNVLQSGEAKSPTSAQLDYGELAVNYSNGDPAVFLKDSNDNVIRIAGKGATGLDGDYVNADGDNMTGNLTVATDKITLTTGGNITAFATITANAFSGDGTNLTGVVNSLPDGTTTQKGIVQLSTDTGSTSSSLAATSSAVKSAYDRGTSGLSAASTAQTTANAALPKSGGTITGSLTVNNTITSGGYSMASLAQL